MFLQSVAAKSESSACDDCLSDHSRHHRKISGRNPSLNCGKKGSCCQLKHPSLGADGKVDCIMFSGAFFMYDIKANFVALYYKIECILSCINVALKTGQTVCRTL